MAKVLILGGGFGGVAAAVRLRTLAPDVEVVLVDRRTEFFMGFRKTAEIVGDEPVAAGSRPLAALERHGIRFVHGEITAMDAPGRMAVVGGEAIEADAMLVALGAQRAPETIDGLSEHGLDVYGRGVAAAAEALASLRSGRVVVGIFGNPYPCSPAPFELALLIQEKAAERGARLDVEVFSPLPSSLPVVGPSGCEAIEGRLAGRLIDFRANAKAERVEPGRVVLEGGEQIPFDVLLAVPPHRVPEVLVDAGLAAPGGWVKVSPPTLRTPVEGVWAVGDCVGMMLADGKAFPKAGVLAENAGLVAAERIAAFVTGGSTEATFDGQGGCYIETGSGEAMMVRGRFLADPPEVELTPPSRENLEAKKAYERDRLAAWFGS